MLWEGLVDSETEEVPNIVGFMWASYIFVIHKYASILIVKEVFSK